MTAVVADLRLCPSCGESSAERYCPHDGTVTVVRRSVPPEDLAYRPGHVVDGRYRVAGRLGRGGFGAVFAATHVGTGQEVALKVLTVDSGPDRDGQVRRFWQEAQVTARLRHANTVRVFDVGQTEEGAFYLTMELLRGRTLADLLEQRGRLAEREAVELGIEVLRSLHEAHAAGLVHRDLKPANVMIGEAGDDAGAWVKVLDFGIARAAGSSLTGTGMALGTPAYMSPEQCRGEKVDARSDLYALGALLFHCVAGRPPFQDQNPLTVMFQHAATPVPDPRVLGAISVSDAFVALVQRALAKEAGVRFEDARAMRVALEGVRAGGVAAAVEGAQTAVQWAVTVPPAVQGGGETAAYAVPMPVPTEEQPVASAVVPLPAAAALGPLPAPGWRAPLSVWAIGLGVVAAAGLAWAVVAALQGPVAPAPAPATGIPLAAVAPLAAVVAPAPVAHAAVTDPVEVAPAQDPTPAGEDPAATALVPPGGRSRARKPAGAPQGDGGRRRDAPAAAVPVPVPGAVGGAPPEKPVALD